MGCGQYRKQKIFDFLEGGLGGVIPTNCPAGHTHRHLDA
uniref:Uncharacterized protein n=1 Tax=Vibrio cholerae non-O1/non-O139 TaxID=156539 RepID=A0A220ISY8_VIBCL|nr:hypothetical protein [Vibrio cholerae non-O1/non-O139]